MTVAPINTAPINCPGPYQDRSAAEAEAADRTGRLFRLVRALIDYGKHLASTLQQRISATDLADVTRHFGTIDVAVILARITRGLHRAAALEARLASQQAAPAAPRAAFCHSPRAARPAERCARAADPRLERLPTSAEIAAEVRRRPVGAVIADICRDLGIVPSHKLWQELALAIIEYGGKFVPLVKDIFERASVWLVDPPAGMPSAGLPPHPVARSTGPP
jgi:hypothetical protein